MSVNTTMQSIKEDGARFAAIIKTEVEKEVGMSGAQVAAVYNGTTEVQEITVAATGGTYTITFDGQTTGAIAFDAVAATVQTALEGLSNVDAGDIVVTGGPGDAGGTSPYVLTFGGQYADTDVNEVTTDDGSLTGTTSVATTGQGDADVATFTVTITDPADDGA